MQSSGSNHPSRRQFLKSVVWSGVGISAGGIGVGTNSGAAPDKPLVLAEQGKSRYTILISQAASPSEQRAAAELQRFIQEMSGAHLPIVTDANEPEGELVMVGDSKLLRALGLNIPYDTLGAEGFVVRTAGQHLIIAGGRQRGTMYGVYTFLDKLGCRWFTSEVSVIPKKPTLVIEPLNERHKPAFEYREPFFTEAADKDWAARNRVNGSFQQLDESTGSKVSYYPFVHSFYTLLPPNEYFHDHPEYYALVDGKRRGDDAQLCLTNPEVLRLAIQSVLKWIDEHPEASILSVSQNDTEGWCECDNCRRVETEEGGVHSGPILRFVNAVAAEVGKTHPDKLIDTLAYWYSEPPPLKVRPLPNVRIRLCPIGVCEAHAYDACVHDRYFMNNLQAWAKITDQLYIWHYVTNFAHYLLPFPDFDELAADLPMYKQHGVVGIFLEGDAAPGGGGENAELRSYIMARLLWDTNFKADKGLEEFISAYYGSAARTMLAYQDLLQSQVRMPPKGRGRHAWIYTRPGADYLSPEFLAAATKLLDAAEAEAADEATHRRVRKARLSIDYVKLVRARTFVVRDGWYSPENLDQLKENFRHFLQEVRSFGITQLHEGSPLEEDEKAFAKYTKPYRVTTLENSALRLTVAPELSGRIISIIDRATETDVMHHPDPGEFNYPDASGLGVFVFPDYILSDPYEATWELEPQPGPGEIRLAGTCSNGLRMKRTLRLLADRPALHTETTVENAGASAVDAVLNAACNLAPQHLDNSILIFRSQSGKEVQQAVLPPEKEPSGSRWFADSDQPDGQWTLTPVATQRAVASSFPRDQVTRCSLAWTGKAESHVTMSLWSAKRALAPGEILKLEADYEIIPSRGAR